MLEKLSVFQYQNYHSYLRDVLGRRKVTHPGASIRATAKRLGFQAPSYLVMILQGKRKFPIRSLPALSRILEWNSSEARYFENLIHFNHAKSVEEKTFYEKRLAKLNPSSGFSLLDMDSFRMISDPLHFTILEMTSLKGFQHQASWIQKRLEDFYTVTQVQEAMNRLGRLGLLKIENGTTVKTHQRVTTPTDIASDALKSFHKISIDKAMRAIDTQDVLERDITSSTLTIDRKKLKEAKVMVREFKNSLCKFLEAQPGCGTDTYQLNVQLFRLTKNQQEGEKNEN